MPLSGRAIIKPDSIEEKTKSGIVLPDTASKEKPHQGKVIAISENSKKDQSQVKIGDSVLYPEYGGDEIKINDEELIVIEIDKILAIIK